jgi:signal transduction histidine kinase
MDLAAVAHPDGEPVDPRPPEVRGIYRDIHDRVAGDVSVAFRNLELYELYRDRDPDEAHRRILRAKAALDAARESIRVIVEGGTPFRDIGGLEKALRDFTRAVRPEDVAFSISVIGDEKGVSAQTRAEAFIVIREALHNALRHAEATRLSVAIEISSGELRATVEDDGRGFDPRRVGEMSSGIGVRSMCERVARMRGRLLLDSRPGKGTRIELVLPV